MVQNDIVYEANDTFIIILNEVVDNEIPNVLIWIN